MEFDVMECVTYVLVFNTTTEWGMLHIYNIYEFKRIKAL